VFIYDELDENVEKYLQKFCDIGEDVETKFQEILKLEQTLLEDMEAIETTH